MAILTFLGAARTVTGSKYLVDVGAGRALVDCGLFQGLKHLRELNWQALPVEATAINAVVLTHAHLDHCGYLPRLVAQGFRGRVFCTPGTADLCRLLLPDSARLQEEDARQANRHGYGKHTPSLPLYTEPDAFRAVSQLQPVGFNRPIEILPGMVIEFVSAGHLLGSAFVKMTLAGPPSQHILFGGDLGRYNRPVLPDPSPPPEAEILLCESTYGDRTHVADDDGEALARVVRDTINRGGRVVIPSFAVGRVEEILYWLKRLEDANRIPQVPVFLDSPMAVEALKFYRSRGQELDEEMLDAKRVVSAFTVARLTSVSSPQQSKEVTASQTPAIIISSSGMATGGRVLHHLKQTLPYEKNTVLFVGFQAEGTRGRALVDGATEVKIHGSWVPVSAHIARIDSMSAHADSAEILQWLGGFSKPPRLTYLVHGEPGPMDALRSSIERLAGWTVRTPALGEQVPL
jgi:metallo-beta-lactamase family protein